ncbi:MAG: hypothetical protein Q8Q96_01340 [bacterium]|nr:hypothetical protein [bacterium]
MGHKEREHRKGDRELCRRLEALPGFIKNRTARGIRSVHPRSAKGLTTPGDNVLPHRNDQGNQEIGGGFLVGEILPTQTIVVLNEMFHSRR